MGMFSWITSDTKESVANVYSGKDVPAVKLIDNVGNEYFEDAYEGYGDFGGVDYYELAALMNGATSREDGIDLAFNAKDILLPKVVSAGCTLSYDELPDSESCAAQGFFYEEMEAYNNKEN